MPRHLAPIALFLLLAACGDGQPLLPPDATLPDGSRYHGQIVDGRLQGQGRLDRADGSHYSGQFKDGLFDGQGELVRADGSRYQGHFVRGQPEGEGRRSDAEGTFSGTFAKGLLQGQGHYQSEDGGRYDGGFRDDQFHGTGRYQSRDGDVWSGHFDNGALNGQGEFHGADGSHYAGQFRDWSFHGQGRLSLADGSLYQGHFAHGEYAGEGTLTAPDGSRIQGLWSAGELLRDAHGKPQPDPLELGLLRQGQLLQEALDALPASTPAVELYSLTLAGDGRQSVFLREADYVSALLRERFGARGNITLSNHRDHLTDRPLATRESLTRAVQALAERSGPEDLVFIYLTSHGSSDHQLTLDQPRLQLADLPAGELAALLAPLRERDKVIVISACYSGGFIPPLKNDKTLVMTAARADRVSFGCSEESDFTYFGRALFAEALNQTDDLNRAFEQASRHVAEREKAEGFEPSEPQLWAPQAVLNHWKRLRAQQAEKALMATKADQFPAAPADSL